MSSSRFMLASAAGVAVFSVLAAIQLAVSPISSANVLHAVRRNHAPLLFTGLAAVSTAWTAHLAASSSSSSAKAHPESASSSDDGSQSGEDEAKADESDGKDTDKATDADKDKRWLKKDEIWSEEQEDWVERKHKPEEKADDAAKKAQYLFTVKHRVMPKQPNSEGYHIVQFTNSQHIVEVLRSIIKDSEDLFDDKATLDVKELFLAKTQIQDALDELKAEVELRKEEDDDSKDEKTNEADSNDRQGDASEEKTINAEDTTNQSTEESVALTPPTVDQNADERPQVPLSDEPESVGAAAETSGVGRGTKDVSVDPERRRRQSTTATVLDVDAEDEAPKVPKLPYSDLKQRADHVEVLLAFVSEHFASVQAKLDRILPKGLISFKLLWTVIKPGMLVKMTHKSSGEPTAFQVRRCNVRVTMTGEQFYVSGMYLEWTGEKYIRMSAADAIPAFTGLRKLSSLDCSPVSEADRAAFLERGKLYSKYAGTHYMYFTGALITPGQRPGTYLKRRAEGRVMIDMSGYRKMNPGMDLWEYPDYDDDDSDYYSDAHGYSNNQSGSAARDPIATDLVALTEDAHYVLTPPTVYGFSMFLSEWGEMLVDSFSEIKFDTHAYDHLELDADHKSLIKALVDASRSDGSRSRELISDVVQGKGGGIIAVLHGNPGVGKTLTAEAVAELLQRPLYVQGAGDLGVDAHTLEHRLRDVLEIARVWQAVVLIDEADIFLEARSHHEVSRNAMVGVFLRTLEYQQGILFLTTNRVKSFDEAFLSRFSVAIRYPDLDQARRRKVWTKFLIMAGCDVEGASPLPETNGDPKPNGAGTPKSLITKKELNAFANESLNGRVVKQTVRTAQALAISKDEPLRASHVEQILRINKRFQEDFEAAAPDYQAAGEGWQSRSSLYR